MAVHFKPFRKEGGEGEVEVRTFIIQNSQTIELGQTIKVVSGFASASGAAVRIMGVANAFMRDLGNGQIISFGTDASSGTTGTRTGNHGVLGSDTYVASSTNQTVDKVMVQVIVDPKAEYHNVASGSLTTAMVGNYFDVVSTSDQIDYTVNATTVKQFILMDLDPDRDAVATKGIFKLVQSQLQA